MYKVLKGYLIKGQSSVVIKQPKEEYEEVTVCISMTSIKEWAEEIEMLGLDKEG